MTLPSRALVIGVTFLSLFAMGVDPAVSLAQQQAEDDRPRFVLNTRGPASRTRAVAFSNDSARLFAAGFDKTVHVWDVGWNPDAPEQATPVQTLRWEIARANRGLINIMAVCPTAERIAIGGQSARGANGDIILMDVDRYQVEGSLPPVRDEQTALPGHRQSVTSIDFSPDGNRIISSGSDGNVWVWTAPPAGAGPWVPSELRPVYGQRLFNEQPAIFLTNEIVAVAEPLDPNAMTQWRIALYSVAAGIQRIGELPQVHQGRVSAMARSRDGRLWASGDDAGHVFLWTGGPQPNSRVLRHWGRNPSSFSFGPGGQLLAVSNYLDANGQAVVELLDTASGQLLDQFSASNSEHCNSCTISPDGQYLATHADDTQDVLVFRLMTANAELLPKPLSGQPPIRLHSRAQRVTHVAFKQPQAGQPPYEIGFSNTPDGQILSEFNLSNPNLLRLPAPGPDAAYISPLAFSGGWSAAPVDGGASVSLVFNGREVDRIPLNARRQGEFEGNYCIIPDAQQRPYAIAFGTTTQNGIYAYRLPSPGQPTKLLRYFRDHNGEVLSVGVSADGRYLVSGSEDQTIKVWSLAGLAAENPNFTQTSVWGADFQLEANGLIVRNVLPAGIAFGRQLREGDAIASMLVAQNGQQVTVNNPAQIKAVLDAHPPWETVLFTVIRGGQAVQLRPTVPGWEPLMTLLVDTGGEWALFTPEGFYDASIAEGQTLFGWQINQGRNVTPRFLAAESLQKDFERPDVLQRILTAGSVVEALQANNEPVPADFVDNIAAKATSVPDLKILEPLASQKFGPNEEITVRAEVKTAQGVDPNDFRIRATIGGRFIGEPLEDKVQPTPDGGATREIVFKAPPPDRLNRIQIFAVDNKEDSLLNAANNTTTVFNRAQPAAPERLRKLHILALASNNYDGVHWDKLEYPLHDMDELVRALEKPHGTQKFYEPGQTEKLRNEGITPEAVQSRIGLIQQELSDVKPYDVVFVYLAGHGKAVDDLYYYVPPMESNSDADVRAYGVPWTLLRSIADLKCNVIWMLDTCESGKIVNKAGVREMSKLSMVVAASTDKAFEGKNYRGGHGAFTASILDGLDGHADRVDAEGEGIADDGIITVAELVTFVKNQVYRSTGRIQEPVVTPSDLVDSPGTIKLAEAPSLTASGP